MVFNYLMRGQKCTACHHPQSADIDDGLASGAPLIPTAAQFGLSKSALARHRAQCLAPRLRAAARIASPSKVVRKGVTRAKAIAAGKAPSPQDVLDLTGLLDRVARSLERLEGAAQTAATTKAHLPLAALSGQLHKGIETAARLQGIGRQDDKPPAAGLTINIALPPNPMQPVKGIVAESVAVPVEAKPPRAHETFQIDFADPSQLDGSSR